MVDADMKRALNRVWSTWRFWFLIAAVIYIVTFAFTLNYEGDNQGYSGEKPVKLFRVSHGTGISAGSGDYIINITNNRDYTIESLTVEFTGIEPRVAEDEESTNTGTLSSGGQQSYSYTVRPGAESFDAVLDGTGIVAGLTNIDLAIVHEASGTEFASTNSGNHEEIRLDASELVGVGYGDLTVTVSHVSGVRSVPFELAVSIGHETPVMQQSASEALEPGDSEAFTFNLNIEGSQLADLRCVISAKVSLPGGMDTDISRTYDSDWKVVSETTPVPEELAGVIPWGPVDITGTTSVALYTTTIIAGFVYSYRIRKKLKPALLGRVHLHCLLALTSLTVAAAHMSAAMQKVWPWASAGMLFAYCSLGTLAAFTIFSVFDTELITKLGRRRWRWIHIALTFLLLAFIVIHFGLMGDHLGFLK